MEVWHAKVVSGGWQRGIIDFMDTSSLHGDVTGGEVWLCDEATLVGNILAGTVHVCGTKAKIKGKHLGGTLVQWRYSRRDDCWVERKRVEKESRR